MDETSILKQLQKRNAIITDSHVVYTSGKHGSAYVNKDAAYPDTFLISKLCMEIAMAFEDYGIEVVVGPEKGAIILSQWVAYHLSQITEQEVFSVYAEKEITLIPDPENKARKCYAETGKFFLGRGYAELIKQKRVLVVEDIITTGGTVKKVVEAIELLKCGVAGIGAICNRSGLAAPDLGVSSFFSVLNIKLDAWNPEDCKLCQADVPINTVVGKGKDFLARKAASLQKL